MKTLKKQLPIIGALSLLIAPASFATVTGATALTSFDPNTHFNGGITAGIDFDDGSPTQSGFTSVPASNLKIYSIVNNGITFDINVNATGGNQNRNRAGGGDLMRDFEQWLMLSGGGTPEAQVHISGLAANTQYDITTFHYNHGFTLGDIEFYNGTTTADPLITTFSPEGTVSDTSTWAAGIVLSAVSNSSGEVDFLMKSVSSDRLTLNGMTVVAVPEASTVGLLGLCALGLILRRRR